MRNSRAADAAQNAEAFVFPEAAPEDLPEGAPECNWGELTSEAIADGFDQGQHASDPSGDGLGPEDRVGLANVIEQGNLHATCEFIADLL